MKPLRRILAEPGTPYGRLALAGLLGFASAAATIGLLAGSGYVIGRAALRPGLDALVGILAAVEVLAFLRGPLRYAERLVGHDAALRALSHWRVWLYDRLTPRVPAALAGWRSGDLLTRAIDDVDTLLDLYLRTLLPIAIAVAAGTMGVVVVGLALPWAALALGLPLLVAAVVPSLLVWRHGDGNGDGAALAGELSALVVDAVHGAPDLLAFGAEDAMLGHIDEVARHAERLHRRQARAGALATVVVQICLAVALTGVLALTVVAVHDHRVGRVTVAVLPLAALATFEPVAAVAQAVARAAAVGAAARRLLALADVPIPVTDPEVPRTLGPGTPDVSFHRASLRYDAGLPPAFESVDLQIGPGARVAVTGSSGAGKSSLVNALLRFWPLYDGTLSLGGIPADQLGQADVRAACALVDQRAHLFAGTLRSNITLGRPDADEADIAGALAAAQLADWVRSLPAGLDTPVGDEGVALSGGERRRVAVARALVSGGPLLILDEPTSGLQHALADDLLDDVLAAAGTRSVLLITHLAGEAARCERTLTLEAGRVIPA